MRNKSWDNQWLLIYFTTAEFRERGTQLLREKGRGRLSKMCLNAILRRYKWAYESYPVIHYYSSI